MAGPHVNGVAAAAADLESWSLLSPQVVLAVVAVATLLVYLLRPKEGGVPRTGSPTAVPAVRLVKLNGAEAPRDRDAASDEPNLQGAFIPPTKLLSGNPPEPFAFENEHSYGMFLPMHRPTWNKALDKSGNYRYGDHFKGRKRLWEMRMQFHFKHTVLEPMRFGIELEEYVPLNSASKKLMAITVAALRQAAGGDLYHSVGDDPKKVSGPREKPVFSMPMWAFDQFIVTPEGEEPPNLTDPSFSSYGTLRTTDRNAFIQELNALELRAGPTYTFSFWGISQFLDDIKWEVTKVIPFKNIDFNIFCGKPPVHVVLYTLREGADGEKRHLQARKDYYFRLAFWSSRKPPAPERIRQLLPREGSHERDSVAAAKKSKNWVQKVGGLFACCATPQRQG